MLLTKVIGKFSIPAYFAVGQLHLSFCSRYRFYHTNIQKPSPESGASKNDNPFDSIGNSFKFTLL